MANVSFDESVRFDSSPIVIVGAGAAGLCAALSAAEAGAEVVVLERDAVPAGSTSLSAGLIPAGGTSVQRAMGIVDNPMLFAADIGKKSYGEADPQMVKTICEGAPATIDWLVERYGFPFDVLDNFIYPGHSAHRMHGLPTRSGRELIDRLRSAVERAGIPILPSTLVTTLFAGADGKISGIGCMRGHNEERIGCSALILACNGYGGNRDLVRRYIPEMGNALYFGHAGNQGDAVAWGEQLGAHLSCLSGYQGHGSVAIPHGILITWAAISEGGFQVNLRGRRFCNEALGYSEQAAEVLKQPEGIAFDIFDERIARIAEQFPDFRDARAGGAIISAQTTAELARLIGVDADMLATELNDVERAVITQQPDRFARSFTNNATLKPPYLAIKVTGALFHTQGGLAVTPQGQVRRQNGTPFPNMFAAGGAAVGVSGRSARGYLSGNGLLTATVLGRIAGSSAAQISCK